MRGAALGLLLLHAATAAGATLRVGSAGYATIGAALAASRPGDTVIVASGTYRENVVVSTTVRLVGEGTPTIVGSGRGDVVRILADDVVLEGFTIRGSGSDMMVSDAGVRIRGARARVVRNRLADNLFGVYLQGCKEALLEGNTITGRAELPQGLRGAGVHLYDAAHNRVRGNRITDVRDGVYFDHADFNVVEGNELARLRYGIHYMYCSDNQFVRNVMRDSSGGAAIMYSERVVFSDNQIIHNRDGYNAFGLLLQACFDAVAERNVIVGNVHGIFLEGSHRNRFERNLVAYNDIGVYLYASSRDNQFRRNDFVGNTSVLYTVGRAQNDWAPKGQGNYYSEYRGFDLDGDGRGDVPHRLQDAFEHLVGNHPLLRLYLSSAAAEALAAAERTFPVIPGGDEQDAAPALRPVSAVKLGVQGAPRRGRPLFALASLALVLGAVAVSWRLRR